MRKFLFVVTLAPLALLLGSCSSSGDGDVDPRDANLLIQLTDAPSLDFRAVNVTIAAVRVHQDAGAGENAAGWREIQVTAPMPVDLMRLRGGVLYDLCRAKLPAGVYQQARLVMVPNSGSNPPHRNSVTTRDGRVHPIDVPSGSVKISHRFTVGEGTRTDLVLDFDAEDSCRQRGNGTYFMEPWITAKSTLR